jgi:hypothetical protein
MAGADGARPWRAERARPFRGAVPVGGNVASGHFEVGDVVSWRWLLEQK